MVVGCVKYGVEIVAWVSAVEDVVAPLSLETTRSLSRAAVDRNFVRCPDAHAAAEMQKRIEKALNEKDSLGGIVTCVCRNTPTGLGEPAFDKVHTASPCSFFILCVCVCVCVWTPCSFKPALVMRCFLFPP